MFLSPHRVNLESCPSRPSPEPLLSRLASRPHPCNGECSWLYLPPVRLTCLSISWVCQLLPPPSKSSLPTILRCSRYFSSLLKMQGRKICHCAQTLKLCALPSPHDSAMLWRPHSHLLSPAPGILLDLMRINTQHILAGQLCRERIWKRWCFC